MSKICTKRVKYWNGTFSYEIIAGRKKKLLLQKTWNQFEILFRKIFLSANVLIPFLFIIEPFFSFEKWFHEDFFPSLAIFFYFCKWSALTKYFFASVQTLFFLHLKWLFCFYVFKYLFFFATTVISRIIFHLFKYGPFSTDLFSSVQILFFYL